jgi:hypothetical protein
VNEEFPNSQKPIPLSLAHKENRERKGYQGGKESSEDHPEHRHLLGNQLFDNCRNIFGLVHFKFSKPNLLLKHLRGVDQGNPPPILLKGAGSTRLPFLFVSSGNH